MLTFKDFSLVNFMIIFSEESPPKRTPCQPSPCGPNSICHDNAGTPSCSCLSEFIGAPPHCRPECVSNSECNFAKACLNSKCVNPCLGACGLNAECHVISHSPQCVCRTGYEGDAFDQCEPIRGKQLLIVLNT